LDFRLVGMLGEVSASMLCLRLDQGLYH
jgi:hypothetical protein